jgi:hypothetical protein
MPGVRAIFVSTPTAVVVGLSPIASAQEQPRPPKPRPTYGPNLRMQAAVTRNVRGMPASVLDPALPPVPLDQWLFTTVAAHLEVARASFANWGTTMCDDRESEIPGPGPLVCVDIEIPIDLERTAHVIVAAGEFVWTSPGRARWEEKPAFLYDVYVAARGAGLPDDTLAVPSLGELDASLRMPRKDWPPSDLQTAVSWSPQTPRPGDIVEITIVVSNKGKRAVDRVHVNVLVGPCCPNQELRHDWFPRIDAGESVRLKASVCFPDGFGMVAATARPTQSPKRVVDKDEATKQATVVMIGERHP